MERAVSHHSPEAVLEHLDWVQALARRLVSDPARAEDLGQEAALADQLTLMGREAAEHR